MKKLIDEFAVAPLIRTESDGLPTPSHVGQLCRVGPYSIVSPRTEAYDWFIAESVSPGNWRQIDEASVLPEALTTYAADPAGTVRGFVAPIIRTAAEGIPGTLDAYAQGTLVVSGPGGIANIGGRTYRYAGATVSAGDIYATDTEQFAYRIADAINGVLSYDIVPYSPAAHPSVRAGTPVQNGLDWEVTITALSIGAEGNSIATTAFGEMSINSPTLTGGASLVTPTAIGQKCIVGGGDGGNTNRLIYTSLDGTTWTLTGASQDGLALPVAVDLYVPGNIVLSNYDATYALNTRSVAISTFLTE